MRHDQSLKLRSKGRPTFLCQTNLPRHKLDKALTFCRHLESLRGIEMSSKCHNVAHNHPCLCPLYSSAEYCAPAWWCSALTRLIDKPINDVLRIVIACLRPTPTDNLFVLARIQPFELRGRNSHSASRSPHPGARHLLHKGLVYPSFGHLRELKLRDYLCLQR